MTVRNATIDKYLRAALEIQDAITRGIEYFDTHSFTQQREISSGLFTELVRAGFLVSEGKGVYRRTAKPLTRNGIQYMLETIQQRKEKPAPIKPAAYPPPANDPVQRKLELTQEPKQPEPVRSVTRADYEALERRVASLEQLLIRRGVA